MAPFPITCSHLLFANPRMILRIREERKKREGYLHSRAVWDVGLGGLGSDAGKTASPQNVTLESRHIINCEPISWVPDPVTR